MITIAYPNLKRERRVPRHKEYLAMAIMGAGVESLVTAKAYAADVLGDLSQKDEVTYDLPDGPMTFYNHAKPTRLLLRYGLSAALVLSTLVACLWMTSIANNRLGFAELELAFSRTASRDVFRQMREQHWSRTLSKQQLNWLLDSQAGTMALRP